MVALRDLRLAAGLTQDELGLLAGLSQTEVAAVEVGKRQLSSAARMRMIRALDLERKGVESVPELTPFPKVGMDA